MYYSEVLQRQTVAVSIPRCWFCMVSSRSAAQPAGSLPHESEPHTAQDLVKALRVVCSAIFRWTPTCPSSGWYPALQWSAIPTLPMIRHDLRISLSRSATATCGVGAIDGAGPREGAARDSSGRPHGEHPRAPAHDGIQPYFVRLSYGSMVRHARQFLRPEQPHQLLVLPFRS